MVSAAATANGMGLTTIMFMGTLNPQPPLLPPLPPPPMPVHSIYVEHGYVDGLLGNICMDRALLNRKNGNRLHMTAATFGQGLGWGINASPLL